MSRGWMGGYFWTSFALLAAVAGGPLHRYPRESEDYQNDLSVYANYTANEVCFSEGEVFQKGDVMPNPGPCEECRCEPPSIVCNMIKCPTNNNGCRTIQRANHCCPDYNCECDYNGQLYNDGERLDLPEEPCQVCYCKGGEVMCNSITCYHRDDCDPIQVPGQCCPKYENCPVRDMGSSSFDDKNVLVRSTNKTNHVSPKREMNPWLLTKLPPVSSSPPKSSQEATTEGGIVIIVSDWLTERRTTTDDGGDKHERSTRGPDVFTSSDQSTTVSKPEVTSGGEAAVKNAGIVTPIDEVIFTRIDGQKENHAVNWKELTTTPSTTIQNSFKTPMSDNVVNTQTEGNKNYTTSTESSIYVTNKNAKETHTSIILPEKQSILEVLSVEMSADIHEQTNPSVENNNTDYTRNISSTESYTGVFNNTSGANSNNTDLGKTLNIDLSKESNEKIIRENEGLDFKSRLVDKSFIKTTTEETSRYQTMEKQEISTDINEFTANSIEGQTKDVSMLGKLENIESKVKTTNDILDTTTNSLIDKEVLTTPLFTEVYLKHDLTDKDTSQEKLKILANELSNSNNDNMSSQNKSDVLAASISNQKEEKNKENILSTDVETSTIISYSPSQNEDKMRINNIKVPGVQEKSNINIENTTIQQIKGTPEEIAKLDDLISNNTSVTIHADTGVASSTLVNTGDEFDDNKEFISDAPPVLELNSHVPFLQLGGHGIVDAITNGFEGNIQTASTNEKESGVIVKDSVANVSFNIPNNNLPNEKNNSSEILFGLGNTEIDQKSNSKKQEINEDNEENDQRKTETTTDITFTTSHIPLTPGDLKALAEYLINHTIKPVEVKNVSDYIPNQWLKSNITSENMSSIISAANVSINIMNKTEDKVKKFIAEATARIGSDKFEQDKIYSGNSVLNNVRRGNKTSFHQGKKDEYIDSPKINSEPKTLLTDEAEETLQTIKTEPPISIEKSLTKTSTTINSPDEYQIKIDRYYSQSERTTPPSTKKWIVPQTPFENNFQVDKFISFDKKEANQVAQSIVSRNGKSSENTPSLTSILSATTSDPQ